MAVKDEFKYTDFDREFWDRELDDFVPAALYDMHTHLWTQKGQEHMLASGSPLRMEVSFKDLREWSARIYPGRECHFLLLATPNPGLDADAHNRWLYSEAGADPDSICSMLVTPDMAPGELDAAFAEFDFAGVKPYRLFAESPADARIKDFLPEQLMEVVNHHGKAVTLHLSLKKGPADQANLDDLKNCTSRYPGIKWILAHCARGFNSCLLEKPVHELKYLPNLWYDTSAVNDLYSHYLLFKHENIERIMFGSDNVSAGCAHGKYITYAYAWRFYDGREPLQHCDARPVPVIYEQLVQQKRAADMAGLTQADIEKVFHGNAERFVKCIRAT